MTVANNPDALLRHAEAVRRLARRLVHDDDQVDDVLQDACIVALRSPPPSGVPVRAWLTGIVRNLAARRRRDESRRLRRESARAERAPVPDPHELAARAETYRALVQAVLLLNEPYRTTMLLRFFDGLRPSEIAKQLGVPPATVSTHIHRGLAQLRTRLDEDHDGRRASWFLALMPLAAGPRPPVPVTTTPFIAAGALLVGTKTLIAGAVALLLAALFITYGFARDTEITTPEGTGPIASTDPTLGGRSALDPASAVSSTPPPLVAASAEPLDRRRDLHGLVLDEEGRPLAGVSVETFTHGWASLKIYEGSAVAREAPGPATETGAEGAFRIRLTRDASVHARFRASGYAIEERFDCPAGERLEVRLSKGVGLRVRTVDEDGAPVAGAGLRLWRSHRGAVGMADRIATTDERGEHTFADLRPGSWAMLAAEHARYGPLGWRRVEFPLVGPGSATLALPRGRTIRGRLLDAESGEPIPGGRVGLGWTQHKAVPTDGEGGYLLHGWTGNFYVDLCASAPGYSRERKRGTPAEVVDFALRRGATLTGRIVTSDGEPVEGARLALSCAQLSETRTALTDSEGRFQLQGVRRESGHTLVILAAGYGRTLVDLDVAAKVRQDVGDVGVARGHCLVGQVVGGDGLPVAGVAIEVVGENGDRSRRRVGKQPFATSRGTKETRRTNDQGVFRFPDLSPGSYNVSAKPVGQRWIDVAVTFTESVPPEPVVITLRDGRLLRVRVVDDLGAPVIYAHVSAVAQDEYGITCMTNTDGWAEFRTSEPVAEVEVTPGFSASDYLAPPIRKIASDEQELEIVLLRARSAVGRVLDLGGKPVPQAVLTVYMHGKALTQLSTFSENQVFTDLEGRFKVLLPESGRVDIVAMPSSYGGGEILGGRLEDVGGDTADHVLQLRKLTYDRELTVRALSPSGKPAADVHVYARISGSNIASANARTDAEGRATLRGLPGEPVTVYARTLDKSAGRGHWLSLNLYPVRAEGEELELRFEEAVVFVGRVIDKSGEAVAGAFVSLNSRRRPVATSTTDERGEFVFRVSPGLPFPLRLAARKGDRWISNKKIDLETTGSIEITLP